MSNPFWLSNRFASPASPVLGSRVELRGILWIVFFGGSRERPADPGAFADLGGPGGVLGGCPRALGVSWDVVGLLGASWGVSVASRGLLIN